MIYFKLVLNVSEGGVSRVYGGGGGGDSSNLVRSLHPPRLNRH